MHALIVIVISCQCLATSIVWPLLYTSLHLVIILSHSSIYLFIHPFIHSSIYSFIHLFIHPFIHHPFIHSSIYSFIHLFIHPFIHSSIYSFIHLFIHPFIHSFIHSQLIWQFVASEEDYVSQLTLLNNEFQRQFEIAACSHKPPLSMIQSVDIFRNWSVMHTHTHTHTHTQQSQ